MATWKNLLDHALKDNGEGWSDVEGSTMTDEDMGVEFDSRVSSGCPFTLWTKKSVYFPVRYESDEWVGRVARHPDGQPTKHHGA